MFVGVDGAKQLKGGGKGVTGPDVGGATGTLLATKICIKVLELEAVFATIMVTIKVPTLVLETPIVGPVVAERVIGPVE